MQSIFNLEELNNRLKDFYILTRIRITVFDSDFNEITSYPNKKANICSYLRENQVFDAECKKCDKTHMEIASKRKDALLYTCHGGIMEIISPLFLGEKTVGYLFFSHILNYPTYDEAIEAILKATSEYNYDRKKIEAEVKDMPLFTNEYLNAAAHLLEETASYLIYNHIAYLKYEDLPFKIDQFIKKHLGEDLSAKRLCHEFAVGKTNLYAITEKLYGEGLALHIKHLRIEKAKDLIRQGYSKKLSFLASEVGFDDYSYFIVAFKKETGMTPKAFQKLVG